MKEVYGDRKQLRPSEKAALEKLAAKRTAPGEIIDLDLARRAARSTNQLGQQVGLLIGRDGRVADVVLGGRDRIYLPDLGRFRLDSSRLRRLRLVVFLPEGQHHLRDYRRSSQGKDRRDVGPHRPSGRDIVRAPEIANDLLTDLEKLRLDLVLVVAADANGEPGAVSLAHLSPGLADAVAFDGRGDRRSALRYRHAAGLAQLGVDFELLVKDLEAEVRESSQKGYETGADNAVLVGAYTGSAAEARSSMEELLELARTADINVLDTITQRRRTLDPKTLIGKGKIEEVVLHCLDLGADLLVFDRELTPGQLRS
ncbi:MAG: hypothetical protein KDD69_18780, partial [Bdellovibrionales bacterium]|nr:hypothetical protein [Bdellovibrionales bacterium]